MSDLLVIGHRGNRSLVPENTKESILSALSLGIKAVEFDVSITVDSVPIVIHQSTLRPDFKKKRLSLSITRKSKRWTWEHSYEALSALDAGAWSGGKGKFYQIPKLIDLLSLDWQEAVAVMEVKVPSCNYMIDKDPIRSEIAEVECLMRSLVDPIERFLDQGRKLWVLSFSKLFLEVFKKKFPKVNRILAITDRRGEISGTFATVRNLDLFGVTLSEKRVLKEPSWVSEAHARGIKVFVYESTPATKIGFRNWKVGKMENIWSKLVQLGVDGITTDFPGELRDFMEAKARAPFPIIYRA